MASESDVSQVSSPGIPAAEPPGPVEPSQALVDLYTMAVEMADRVSARRGTANAFFLSVQTAFLAVIGVAGTNAREVPWWEALVLALAGISISLAWWLQLRSYRELNRAKFDVINAVEPRLPLQVFSTEWEILSQVSGSPGQSGYMQLSTTEQAIPWVFAVLHAALFIGILCS